MPALAGVPAAFSSGASDVEFRTASIDNKSQFVNCSAQKITLFSARTPRQGADDKNKR
jgi:hypothetical protein